MSSSHRSFVLNSATKLLLFVQQSPAPGLIHRTGNGSESLLFSALPWLLGLSQHAGQSHAQIGSSPLPGDGPQKCRLHVDRNRIQDSREPSLLRTLGHRLPRRPPSGNRQSETALPATVSKSVRVRSDQD